MAHVWRNPWVVMWGSCHRVTRRSKTLGGRPVPGAAALRTASRTRAPDPGSPLLLGAVPPPDEHATHGAPRRSPDRGLLPACPGPSSAHRSRVWVQRDHGLNDRRPARIEIQVGPPEPEHLPAACTGGGENHPRGVVPIAGVTGQVEEPPERFRIPTATSRDVARRGFGGVARSHGFRVEPPPCHGITERADAGSSPRTERYGGSTRRRARHGGHRPPAAPHTTG